MTKMSILLFVFANIFIRDFQAICLKSKEKTLLSQLGDTNNNENSMEEIMKIMKLQQIVLNEVNKKILRNRILVSKLKRRDKRKSLIEPLYTQSEEEVTEAKTKPSLFNTQDLSDDNLLLDSLEKMSNTDNTVVFSNEITPKSKTIPALRKSLGTTRYFYTQKKVEQEVDRVQNEVQNYVESEDLSRNPEMIYFNPTSTTTENNEVLTYEEYLQAQAPTAAREEIFHSTPYKADLLKSNRNPYQKYLKRKAFYFTPSTVKYDITALPYEETYSKKEIAYIANKLDGVTHPDTKELDSNMVEEALRIYMNKNSKLSKSCKHKCRCDESTTIENIELNLIEETSAGWLQTDRTKYIVNGIDLADSSGDTVEDYHQNYQNNKETKLERTTRSTTTTTTTTTTENTDTSSSEDEDLVLTNQKTSDEAKVDDVHVNHITNTHISPTVPKHQKSLDGDVSMSIELLPSEKCNEPKESSNENDSLKKEDNSIVIISSDDNLTAFEIEMPSIKKRSHYKPVITHKVYKKVKTKEFITEETTTPTPVSDEEVVTEETIIDNEYIDNQLMLEQSSHTTMTSPYYNMTSPGKLEMLTHYVLTDEFQNVAGLYMENSKPLKMFKKMFTWLNQLYMLNKPSHWPDLPYYNKINKKKHIRRPS